MFTPECDAAFSALDQCYARLKRLLETGTAS
jgi:hypothetical protein